MHHKKPPLVCKKINFGIQESGYIFCTTHLLKNILLIFVLFVAAVINNLNSDLKTLTPSNFEDIVMDKDKHVFGI
jgi:hypothetical protein